VVSQYRVDGISGFYRWRNRSQFLDDFWNVAILMNGKAIFVDLGGFQIYGFVTDAARRDMGCGVMRHSLASSAESR
jgi:hypothetical protein